MDPFLGEIRPVGFNFAPIGWALCAGQIIPLAQNTALFSLLGIYYGGDGRTTFALPNLQGRIAIGQGVGPGLSFRSMGEVGGQASVTLVASQIPAHTHGLSADANPASTRTAAAALPAEAARPLYATSAGGGVAAPAAIGASGGSSAHNNMMPTLSINYVIALQGVFPPRN